MSAQVRRGGMLALAGAAVLVAASHVTVAAGQGGGQNLLATELGAASRTRDQFQAFERQAAALAKRGKVTSEEAEALSKQAEALKRQLPDLARHATSAKSKLQAAGLWTEQLDRNVADALQKGGKTALLQELQTAGGARRVVDTVASGANRIAAELDTTVAEVRSKTAWRQLWEPIAALFTGTPVHARQVRTVSLFQAVMCLYNGIYGAYCGL